MDALTLSWPAQPDVAAAWERIRQSLWPSPPGEHAAEIASFFEGKCSSSAEALLALDDDGRLIGFADAGWIICFKKEL